MNDNSKKFVVIGGANGIGLAVTSKLIKLGYFVNILDIAPVKEGALDRDAFRYYFFDCQSPDISLLRKISRDESLEGLFISAGVGRLGDFETNNLREIERLYKINAISATEILRVFYERLMAHERFGCGMMVSIAGMICSPLFSVYSASKAAPSKLIEALNVELEMAGSKNRILDVSPGSINGTSFSGGETDLTKLEKIASDIVTKLFSGVSKYIPDFESVYKKVIKDNFEDPHSFGVKSLEHKTKSGRRINREPKPVTIGYLSGTFDLFHVGHLNILRRAKSECDYLVVGVHPSGAWKGKETFIPFDERMAIVESCKYVDKVIVAPDEDSDAWDEVLFDKLFVGSDYVGTERFARYEKELGKIGVGIVYFPYTQGTSSTQLRNKLKA